MKLWKRNAIVAAIVLFVCVAVYLNWSYQQEVSDTGKTLGQATLVGGKSDPLLAVSASPNASAAPSGSAAPAGSTHPSNSAAPAIGDANTADASVPNVDANANTGASTGYFASARLNRQQARDSALAILQDTVNSDTAEEAAKAEAGESIETLAAATVSEAQIENLVIAKGYSDCVAFISEGGVSVVVPAMENGLQESDVARITEIVSSETGVSASHIKIIEAES